MLCLLGYQGYPGYQGFPCGSAGKETACNAGDLGLIPGLGQLSGEGKGYPLQYSGMENSMDRGAWQIQSTGLQKVRHDRVTNTITAKPI